MKEIWIGVNKDGVWPLEHEGDYNVGDVLIYIKHDSQGAPLITVKVVKE